MKILTLRNIVIVSILVILVLFILHKQTPQQNFISIRLYDKDGNQIKEPGFFSIVNGVTGVYYIDYTLGITNTGDTALRCTPQLISTDGGLTSSPVFDCPSCAGLGGGLKAIDKTTQVINVNRRYSWTSNLIPTTGAMEAITPRPFILSVALYCEKDQSGSWVFYQTQTASSTPLSVYQTQGTIGFNLNLGVGGVPSEWCGDGTCQTPLEGPTNCPMDCS